MPPPRAPPNDGPCPQTAQATGITAGPSHPEGRGGSVLLRPLVWFLSALDNNPQIVNFAVSAGVVSAFLDDEGIPYETAPSDKAVEPVEVAAAATKYTVLVECWN